MAGGRPTVMTPEIVRKLEEAFLKGCTDVEACLFAGISRSTLHTYQVDNPEFISRKEELKNQPALTAKLNLVQSIVEGNLQDSKWYLERKNKAEFSTSSDINLGGQENGRPIETSLKIEFVSAPKIDENPEN